MKISNKIWLVMVILFLVISGRAWAITKDDVLFYAPFESSFDAEIAAGNPRAIVKCEDAFVEGYRGKGILAYGGRKLTYETAGNLDLKAGTVALWIKPIDWSGDSFIRSFFKVTGQRGNFLWLYKNNVSLYAVIKHSYDKRHIFLAGKDYEYKKDQWVHAVTTWNGSILKVYINGDYTGTMEVPTNFFVKELSSRFTVGGQSQRPGSPADTVLDEFYIFRRALAPEEVRQLYEAGFNALKEPVKIKPIQLPTVQYSLENDNLRVEGWIPDRRIDDARELAVTIKIKKAKGWGATLPAVKTKFTGNFFTSKIELAKLSAGDYLVSVTVREGKKKLGTSESTFNKPKAPPWLNNKLGITDEIPRPWTPLVQKENKVRMWGRQYDWGKSLLPMSIVTQDKELLLKPISLKAIVSGEPAEVTVDSMKWSQPNRGRVELASSGKIGALEVTADWWLEFDGFAWCKLTIKGPAKETLDSLSLEIPLRPEMATLEQLNIHGDMMTRTGKVRPLSLKITKRPVLWIGNEIGGLQWCIETDRTWKLKNKNRQIEVVPTDKEVMLRINIVDYPVAVDKPLELEFGLEATPVKPRAVDWREKYTGDGIWWPTWSTSMFTLDLVDDWRRMAELSLDLSPNWNWDDANFPLPYMNLTHMWSKNPDFKLFSADWSKDMGAKGRDVCRASKTLQDYWLWQWKTIFDENPEFAKYSGGIYMDTASAKFCFNETHGCAVRDEHGQLKGKYFILGAREYQKRLYIMMQKEHPEYRLVQHQSDSLHMMQLAFVHQFLDGEHMGAAGSTAIVKDLNYYNISWFTLEGIRAEFMGRNFGFIPIFLPQPFRRIGGEMGDSGEEKIDKTIGPGGIPASEHVAGMLFVHDIVPWNSWMNPLAFDRIAAIKKRFIWDRNVKFLPYWNNEKYVKVETTVEPVVCSLYQRGDKILIVVMNNSDTDAEVKLQLDFAALGGFNASQALDAYQAASVKSLVWDKQRAKEVKKNIKQLVEEDRKNFKYEQEIWVYYGRVKRQILVPVDFPAKQVNVPVADGLLKFSVKKRNLRIFEIVDDSEDEDDQDLAEFLKNRNPLDAD